MSNSWRLTFRKGDLLAALAVIVLAAGLSVFLWVRALSVRHTSVEIYQNGEQVQTLPLNSDREFTLSGDYTNTVTVKDGKIAITHSTCPGSDCVHSGWISRAGQSIVCLPNRTEIRVVGDSGADGVDAIAG